MTNSHYFTSFSSNFFDDLFLRTSYFPAIPAKSLSPRNFSDISTKLTSREKFSLPKQIPPPPLKKEFNLTILKGAAQACQVGRLMDTPGLYTIHYTICIILYTLYSILYTPCSIRCALNAVCSTCLLRFAYLAKYGPYQDRCIVNCSLQYSCR